MAKTTEELLQENNDLLRGVLSKSSGGSTPVSSSGGGGAGVPGWVNTVAAGTSNALGATSKFASGLYGVSDALGNMKQLGGVLGPVGTLATSMGAQVAEAGLTVNRSLNTVAASGIHLGQNLGLYEQAVLQARMSLPEFENLIKQNSKSLAGLGANMDKSALVFLSTAKKMQEDDFAYALKGTGTQTEEFGQILTLVAHNSRQDNLMAASSQKNLINTSLALAAEMDNTARIAGISRQEQQQALERQLKSKDMELAMAAMDEQERASVTESIAVTKKYGDAVQNAIRIYATGGVTNADEQKQVLAAGPLREYAEQLVSIKGTTKEDEEKRKQIIKQMDETALSMANNRSGIQEMTIQMKAGSDTTKAMAGGYLETMRYGQTLAKQKAEADAKGISLETYQAQEKAKVEAERLATLKKGEGAPEGREAQLGLTLNKMDTLFKDVTAGAGTYFKNLNAKVGDTIGGMGDLNNVLKKFTAEQMSGIPDKFIKAANDKLGVKPAAVPEPVKKETGSLGTVGKLIEDFGAGTSAILHGKEGVITEDQLKGIVSTAQNLGAKSPDIGVISKQMGPMLSSIQGSLRSDLEKAKGQMPTASTFEKMFSQVQTASQPQRSQQDEVPVPRPVTGESDIMTDMVRGINGLNKQMERLIAAVEDGHNKSVKAIKNTGNLIA